MNKKALVIDIASDFNRGDAIMQTNLCQIIKSIDDYHLTGISIYGSNEHVDALYHFDESSKEFDEIIPGYRKTFNLSPKNKLTKIKNILSLLVSYIKPLLSLNGRLLNRESPFNQIKSKIIQSDLIIWNGRNFRNRKGIGEFYDILCFTYLIFYILIFTKKKILFYGLSIWKLNLNFTEFLVKLFLKNKRIETWSREDFSHKYLNSLQIENYRCMDLSFSNLLNLKQNSHKILRKDYGLILTDWKEDGMETYNNYVKSISSFINELPEESKIYVVPQVFPQWESYIPLLDDIIFGLDNTSKNKIIKITDKKSTKELFDLYSGLIAVISTRMHGSIFARFAGATVLSISYDTGAKWEIFKDLNMMDNIIKLKNISHEILKSKFKDAIKYQIKLKSDHISKACNNDKIELKRFISNI